MIALGDSHVKMYNKFVNSLCMVPGATVYGLANSSSSTEAKNIFEEFLRKNPNEVCITCLGEVDCNALIWRKGLALSDYLTIAIMRYVEFLGQFTNKFIVSSVVLPIIHRYDGRHYKNRKKSPRSYVGSSKSERSMLVRDFNSMLKLSLSTDKHYFLDITTQTMNKKGFIKRQFIDNLLDAHLKISSITPIIEAKLNEAKSFCHNI